MNQTSQNKFHNTFVENVEKTCESKYHKGEKTRVIKGFWYQFNNGQVWCPICLKDIVEYNIKMMKK